MVFHPSLAVVTAILSTMFSLTFLVLVYAKFCHFLAFDPFNPGGDNENELDRRQHRGLFRTRSRFSGIDKTIIDSLLFFRFSSLRESWEGLKCVACLSKFEDIKILWLLPKCKHAFHIDYIDFSAVHMRKIW
ncbi:PREDICTED: E3 ubiquitin-protein ligase ATL42-like [Nelumbo nucifera]|uniref:E3 ubiquitin-protein ligase ATL42-like n=1 Tax=Nelumbo nucifera TaxID=4432 RepID=A0A1U8PY97_NELNU|nr:PREDICTED: E3 ubiquitin-protein ligase ATL42-like [Nelumbo nucifera]